MKATINSHQGISSLNNKQQGYAAVLIAMLMYGTTYVAAKFALNDISPITTAFIRFLLASLIAWPILYFTHNIKPIKKEFVWYLIGSGLFQTTFYFALQYTGMRYTTTSNTSLIVNSRPIVLAILGFIFLHEKLNWKQWIGLLIAFGGVALLIGGQNSQLPPIHMYGDFLIVLNAVSGAIGIICAKRTLEYLRPFTAMVYQITIGAIGLLPMALFESGGKIPTASVGAWWSIVYMAIFTTILCQLFLNIGLKSLPASIVAPFYFIVPFINVIVAYFVLHEPITWALAVGGVLIMIGTLFSNRMGKTKETIVEEVN